MAKKKNSRTQAIPENESKADRFKRVVTPRINKAVKAIEVIGFCGGSSYEYTPKQVEQISEALFAAIAKMADSFVGDAPAKGSFQFAK